VQGGWVNPEFMEGSLPKDLRPTTRSIHIYQFLGRWDAFETR